MKLLIKPRTVMYLVASAMSVSLSTITTADDTIIIKGNRLDQPLGDVAGQVTVIDAEFIESIQAKDIGDIFDYEPSVDVVIDSRYGIKSINIRGLEGNYVKIKVDNVDQASSFDNTGLIGSSRLDLDVDLISTVEIIKGPSSSTQGSDALGGTVLFTTKSPADILNAAFGDDTAGYIKTDYHNDSSSFSKSVVLANRYGKLESMIAYTGRSASELDNFGIKDPQDTDSDYFLAKLQYQLNDEQRLEFTAEYVDRLTNTTPAEGSPVNDPVYDVYYFAKDNSNRKRVGIKHLWQTEFMFFDRLIWQLDWQNKKQDADTFRQCSTASQACRTGRSGQHKDYYYEEDGYLLDAQFNKSFTTENIEHHLAYGLTYKENDYDNKNITRYDDDGDGVFDDRTRLYFYMPFAKSKTSGIYLQDEISLLSGSLLISPGIRFDSFKVNPREGDPATYAGTDEVTGYSSSNNYQQYSESAITARLGLVYTLSDDLTFYAQYSEGFKAPDFQQLYYSWSNDAHGYRSVPNPELEAEFSHSYEVGLRSSLSDKASFEFNIFYSDYEDFIDRVTDFSDPAFPRGSTTNININEATIKGAELSANVWLDNLLGAPEGMNARVAWSHTEGEDSDNNPLQEINPWSMLIAVAYDAPDSFWGSSLKIKYVSEKDKQDVSNPDSQFIPEDYFQLDLNVYMHPVEELTLRLGIYNLLDEKYHRWSDVRGVASDGETDYYSQAGINFAFTAKYTF